jgi:hypothetical protein
MGHRFQGGIIVALEAQAGPGFDQKRTVGRRVRAMARIAPIVLDNGVNCSLISWVIVAFDTKLFFGGHQKCLVIRAMGIVASVAPIVLYDRVKLADL